MDLILFKAWDILTLEYLIINGIIILGGHTVSYSTVGMKFNSNNVSFNFWRYSKTLKLQYTIENPYKMVSKNTTF